ncbi:tetratricopeptide repeat protein [Paracoccus indicus]|uniref:tetratricopeptide repeat protein n=1 Tax=Paracoccus indicus TaxID=2079229 RepID=UPI000D3905A8|nr:tetratricopeptide repeat protein [Paracoccus indicus]
MTMAETHGKLIAFRADRMGGRLIALLNTMRFARSFDLPFVVHWRDSDGLGDGTELFDKDFVRDHFIDKPTYQEMKRNATAIGTVIQSASREQFMENLRGGMHVLLDPPFDVLKMPFEDQDEVNRTFREVVASVPLNPVLAQHLRALGAKLRDDGRRTVAYHIRRGDLTSDLRAMNRAWPNKFVPDEFFEAHIRANMDGDGARTILFSDNQSVLDRYTAMFPELLTFSKVADTTGLTELQRDALELFAMSMSDLIVAPPSSAFSSTAKTIGGGDFRDVESDITPEARHAALDLLASRLKTRPELFANEGEIGQYLVYACEHLVKTGRRGEFVDLARQHIEAGLNIAFIYAMAFREMFFDGQYQAICDLRPAVDRGFVTFQRSYAQIALYHGLALLMLRRKPEAMEQITSAFWHEPVEGEINALAGLLRGQGDYHDGNFWVTDTHIEQLFPNRFIVDHIRNFYTAPVEAGILTFGKMVPTNRVMVWEWPDFTRSDLRSHYKFRGHFRSILKILERRTWSPALKPHFDSFTGMIALREGDLALAEELMLQAIDAKPEIALFHKRLAELRHEQDRHDDALAAMDKAIALEPGVTIFRAMRGLFQWRAGDAAGAADLLVQIVDEGQLQFPSVYFLAADAAQDAGRIEDAVRILERGLSLAPMNWRRQHALAEMKAQLGDAAGAGAVLDWALQWADDHPPLVMLKSDLLVEAGQVDRARALLERLMVRYPDKKQYMRRHKKLANL